jgi:LysR family hydrogen peroxide-inducible transcriptional activator
MRAGAARGAEYAQLAEAMREALRPLPVRVLGPGA